MYQKTIIIGNVGRDPETRDVNGKTVCNFSVAVTERWKDRDRIQHEKTTWFRVAAWRKLGEICSQYVHTGMRVMVEGNIEAQAYTNSNGDAAASLELTAREVKFLNSKQQQQHDDYDDAPPW
jgi:single-strand DNA-binding protein